MLRRRLSATNPDTVATAPLPAPAPAADEPHAGVAAAQAAAEEPEVTDVAPEQPLAERTTRSAGARAVNGAPRAVNAAAPTPAPQPLAATPPAPAPTTPTKPRGVLGPAFVLDLWQLAARAARDADEDAAAAVDAPPATGTDWVAITAPGDDSEGGVPTVYLVPSGGEEAAGAGDDQAALPATDATAVDDSAATATTLLTPPPAFTGQLAFEGGFFLELPPLVGGGYGGGYGGDSSIQPPSMTAEEHSDAWIKVLGGGGVLVGGEAHS